MVKLVEEMDANIPVPERAVDGAFLMPVEDVFSISGRGTVVTGRIERGIVKVNDEVEIIGLRPTVKTICTGWRCSASCSIRGRRGTTWGCCCGAPSVRRSSGGRCSRSPDRSPRTPSSKARCALTKEEGGRHTPFFKGYRPQFYFRTTDVTGAVELPEGVEMVMPGDNIKMTIELISPIAMEEGLRFAIREGGRTVGAGVVSKILK